MNVSPWELKLPVARRAACLALLAKWDARNPWDDDSVQALTSHLHALITDFTKPRILDVRGGETAAKLLRGALGSSEETSE